MIVEFTKPSRLFTIGCNIIISVGILLIGFLYSIGMSDMYGVKIKGVNYEDKYITSIIPKSVEYKLDSSVFGPDAEMTIIKGTNGEILVYRNIFSVKTGVSNNIYKCVNKYYAVKVIE